jgi:hypothetical protein
MVYRWLTIRVASAGTAVVLMLATILSLSVSRLEAATTYTVYNSPVNSFEGSEIVDVDLTSNGRFALIVGTNDAVVDGRRDAKVRVVNTQTREKVTQSGGASSFDLRNYFGADLGFPAGADPAVSSIAVHPTDNYAIVTVRDFPQTSGHAGKAFFIAINPTTGVLSPIAGAGPVTLGVHPESVAIARSHDFAVVTNEDMRAGQPGTISIIDLRSGSGSRFTVTDTVLPVVPDHESTRFLDDPAPETVAISPTAPRAFVTLQPNNALTIIDVNPATMTAEHTTVPLGYKVGTSLKLRPDGVAVTPDGSHLVTANEGGLGDDPRTVSLFRIETGRSITLVDEKGTPGRPEMVAVGNVGGALRAFVTLEDTDSVMVFNVAPTGLTPDAEVPLNRAGQPVADNPEGIAIAPGLDLVVTANVLSRNVSVIQVTTTTPPTGQKVYLPMITR